MTRIIAALTLIAPLSGCMSRAEHATFRDGLDRGTTTMRSEHLAWSRALAGAPGAEPLPNLTDGETDAERETWLSIREGWHAEFAGYLDASRGNDGK